MNNTLYQRCLCCAAYVPCVSVILSTQELKSLELESRPSTRGSEQQSRVRGVAAVRRYIERVRGYLLWRITPDEEGAWETMLDI